MNDFYKQFPISTESEWIEKTKKQLKGKDIADILQRSEPIEEIEYRSICFYDEQKVQKKIPGQSDFSRSGKTSHNDWINNVFVPKDNPVNMNRFALNQLMNGATGLKIDLDAFNLEEIQVITKEIGFEHIFSTFLYTTEEQYQWIQKQAKENKLKGTAVNKIQPDFKLIDNLRNRIVKALDVQYVGGNVSQEIAYALYKGHETLIELTAKGLNIDEAAKQIKFQFGIGSNYFFELVKLKVFRALWHTIVSSYAPKEKNASLAYIEAETGFLNKSLIDPHTNLLRQTTEALSAVLGGVDELTIRPYNAWSNDNIEKVQRLSLNIALLLKEESYLDKVIDPAGGAYVLEDLFLRIQKKSWAIFQKLEKEGLRFLEVYIQNIANKRIERMNNSEDTLIGVNKYFNNQPSDIKWEIKENTPFGIPLVLEKECNVTA